MKTVLISLFLLASMNLAHTNTSNKEAEVFHLKQIYESKAFELKVQQEKAQILQEGKNDFEFYNFDASLFHKSNFTFNKANMACVEWVYQGPGSREEAIEACRGVSDMSCVEWVYLGPGTRMEAARACRRVRSMECAEWVFQGPGSRADAVEACRGVSDMSCVRYAYQGPGTRADAARACARGGSRPPRDDDHCK